MAEYVKRYNPNRSADWNYGGLKWRLSRSKIDFFIECPRCFYVDNKLGTKRPGFPSFNLNIAVDELFSNPFIVFPTNSARFGYESLYANNWNKTISIDGLNRAYSRGEFRLKYNLRDEVTTCPQAELLFLNKINWSSIRKISMVAHSKERYINPKWSDDFFRLFKHEKLENGFAFVDAAGDASLSRLVLTASACFGSGGALARLCGGHP